MQPPRNIGPTSELPNDWGCRMNGADLDTMNRRVVLRSLAPCVRPYRLGLALALLFKFLLVPLGLVPAFLFRAFVDEVLVGGRIGFLAPLLAGYLIAFGLETLLHTLSARQANRVYNRVALEVRRLIWSSYLAAPDDEAQGASAGEMRTVVDEDVERIESFLSGHVIETGFQATRAVVTAVVIVIISWQLALISLALGTASFGLARWLSRRMRANAELRWPRYYEYVDWLHERIQGWRELRTMAAEARHRREFQELNKEQTYYRVVQALVNSAQQGLAQIKDNLVTRGATYFVGGLFVLTGQMSVGVLLGFLRLYTNLIETTQVLAEITVRTQDSYPGLRRVILHLRGRHGVQRPPFEDARSGELRLRHVNFAYHGGAPVLEDVSAFAPQGAVTAIVGRSGSGKSTMAKLMIGMERPTSGTVTLAGQDLKTIDRRELLRSYAVAWQESMLFNLTIRENLTLADPAADDAALADACRRAAILEFILSLPDRWDTLIGERGIKLSGGQKQRLVIARALLKDAPIVVLDEATSQVDSATESRLQSTFRELADLRTVIVMAHRLSTVELADRVLVLEDGVIAGTGTPGELMRTSPAYRRLFADQSAERR